MKDDKQTVEQYIQASYSKTRDPRTTLVEVLSHCGGEEARIVLNDLLKEGKIIKKKGANGPIIELIPDKWMNQE